jgi:hypothetical protein
MYTLRHRWPSAPYKPMRLLYVHYLYEIAQGTQYL